MVFIVHYDIIPIHFRQWYVMWDAMEDGILLIQNVVVLHAAATNKPA